MNLETIGYFLFVVFYFSNFTDNTYFYNIYFSLNQKMKCYFTKNQKKIEDKKDPVPIIKYEEKYLKEWKSIIENYTDEEKCQKKKELDVCFVMENTPLGNVLMTYDYKRETFKYYSDHIIPYRYLETVGRKFVKQFHCKFLFVDIEEEVQLAENKKKEENKKTEEKNEIEDTLIAPKKNIFAKLKNYNNSSLNGKINVSQQVKKTTQHKIVKENANRYTYEGKLMNFSFLKKIDKKCVDKKYGLSFADFKKINPINILDDRYDSK